MYKVSLAVMAALLSTVASKPLENFKCYEDLILVGFKDSNCKKWDWDLPIGQNMKQCTENKDIKINNQTVFMDTKCNDKEQTSKVSLFQENECKDKVLNKQKQEANFEMPFNKGKCSSFKNVLAEDVKKGVMYYMYSRNDTMYQKWKKKSQMRMNGNGTKMGNMSTAVNFTVDNNRVNGSMQTNNGSWNQQMNISGDNYEVSWKMSEMRKKNQTNNMTKREKTSMKEYRVKFDKYFEYGMETKGLEKGSMTKQCSNTKDCNGRYYSKMCCVSSILTDRKSGKQDSMFRCMNYRLAQANFQMKMNDFTIQMQCTDAANSAMYMTSAFVASMVSMILMALY